MEIARCEESMQVPSKGMVRTGEPSLGFEILITQLLEQSKPVAGEGFFAEVPSVAADEEVGEKVCEELVEAWEVPQGWVLLADGQQPLKGLETSVVQHAKEFSDPVEGQREPALVGEKSPMPKTWKEEPPNVKIMIPEERRSLTESHPKNLSPSIQEKISLDPVVRVEEDPGFQGILKKIAQNHRGEVSLMSNDQGPQPIFPEVAATAKTQVPAVMEGVDMEGNLQKIQEALQKNEITIRTQNQTHLKVQLEPEHLGKVDLDLTLEQGKLTAKINVESEKVLKLFQENLVPLQQVLQRQNVQVDRIQLDLIQNHSGEWTNLGHRGGNHHPQKRSSSGRNKPARISERAISGFSKPISRQELNILA